MERKTTMNSLIKASEVPQALWPLILHAKHEDWPWPFSKIPRWRTAWFGEPPLKLDGNAPEHEFRYYWNGLFWHPPRTPFEEEQSKTFWHPYPIPQKGEWWHGAPKYYAEQTSRGVHFRHGFRWDNLDGYYNRPSFTIKKF